MIDLLKRLHCALRGGHDWQSTTGLPIDDPYAFRVAPIYCSRCPAIRR